MKPRIAISDPSFRYRNSASTSVKKTWAEARKRMRIEAERERELKVLPLRKQK